MDAAVENEFLQLVVPPSSVGSLSHPDYVLSTRSTDTDSVEKKESMEKAVETKKSVLHVVPTSRSRNQSKNNNLIVDSKKSLYNSAQLLNELHLIQTTSEENIALEQVNIELRLLLDSQMQERNMIINALEDEIRRSDVTLGTWHENRNSYLHNIDQARTSHIHTLQNMQDSHRSVMGEQRLEHQKFMTLMRSSQDQYQEREQLRSALNTMEKEAIQARRHHQQTLSEQEHRHLLEKDEILKNMYLKQQGTCDSLVASAGQGLGEKTAQVIEETREAEKALLEICHMYNTETTLHEHKKSCYVEKCRGLELAIDLLGHAAYKEASLQKQVQSLRLELETQVEMQQKEDLLGFEQKVYRKASVKPRENKPWAIDQEYIQHQNMQKGQQGNAQTRPTLYPQQYRKGREYYRPNSQYVSEPEAQQRQKDRDLVKIGKQPEITPYIGLVSEIEDNLIQTRDKLQEEQKQGRKAWNEAKELEARCLMIEGVQEEAQRLLKLVDKDIHDQIEQQKQVCEQLALQKRKEQEQEDDPVMKRLAIIQTLQEKTIQVQQGIRWPIQDGIPPFLSKIDPRDVKQLQQMLKEQIQLPTEPNKSKK